LKIYGKTASPVWSDLSGVISENYSLIEGNIMNNLVLRGICFAQSFRAAAKDRRGVTAIEYALVGALMAAVVVAAVPLIKGGIDGAFTDISTTLKSAI
jgi:Flp pilus assembly pilin Flp